MLIRLFIPFVKNNYLLKGIILLFSLSFCIVVSAKTYYVAPPTSIPAGNDNNPGTENAPWATWGKAFNSVLVNPGDTVLFRGGVYYMAWGEGDYYHVDNHSYKVSRGGTPSNLVYYWAYPGEVPILDCSEIVPINTLNYAIRGTSDNTHFKGLTIRNVLSVTPGVECAAWKIGETNVTIENCTVYNINGHGFEASNCYNVRYINCDAYNCCDSLATLPSLPGERGTGFAATNLTTRDGSTYYKNCRAWNCSDQGFTSGSISYVEWDGCWSFQNGSLQGGGHGFKLGYTIDIPSIPLQRKITKCVAVYNRASGITTNTSTTKVAQHMHVYNNTVYHNGYYDDDFTNFVYGIYIYNTKSNDEEELSQIFRNNISYDNEMDEIRVAANALYSHNKNNWDIPVTLTDSDFASLGVSVEDNIALLSSARQSGGFLPDLGEYLSLKSTSNAVNAGVNVGLSYIDSAPDLGAFEYDPNPTPNNSPAISIIAPSTGSIFTAPAQITITANPSDSDGFITKVEFFNGTNKLGEKTSAPWSLTWNDVPEGTYSIFAVATDNLNAKSSSLATSITVTNSTPITEPLVVTISTPTTGSTFQSPASINITASASDPGVALNKMEFFNGTVSIDEASSAPWSIVWNDVPVGTYSLTAVATSETLEQTTSAAIVVVVNDLPPSLNEAPTVSILNPSIGQQFKNFEDIVLNSIASDPDGTISKVEFFEGSNKIAEVESAPYTYTWQFVSEGIYSVTAVATDNLNATTVSSPVWVEVEFESFPDFDTRNFNLYPNPNNGQFSIVLLESQTNENRSISVTTLEGKSFYNDSVFQEETIKHLNLSYINPGTYVLIVYSGIEIIATKKFIKH